MLLQLFSLIHFVSFHILIPNYISILYSTIQGVMNGITSGTVQVFKVSNISSLLFSNEISRKMMVSNFYHSLGGEWSFIARSIERVLFCHVFHKHIKSKIDHHSPL